MRRFIPFLVVMLVVLGTTHTYIWWRLITPLPAPWAHLGSIGFVLLAPSLPVASILARAMPRRRARPLLLVAYLWFAFATYLLLAAAIGHVAVTAGAAPRPTALVGIGAAALTVLAGLVHVARGPRVRTVEVALPRLPVAALTIVQLSDVHVGPLIGRGFVEATVRRVNALAPDLIVLTGDLIDGNLTELRHHIEPLRELRARHGVYAVTGNHEYYWLADPWMDHIGSLGVQALRNRHVTIADAIVLAGVDDITADEDLPGALAGRDPALPVVLLAHHPAVIHRAAQAGVDLQLSGHTHGGQLLPLGWLARLFAPQVAGLGRFGATWLYVNEGTGYWGPPVRIGTTQEITAITLVPAVG